MGCIPIDQRSHDCADGAVNVTILPNNEVIGRNRDGYRGS